MKKFFVIIVCAFLFASCSDIEIYCDEISEIMFNVEVLETHTITKSIENNDVINLIEQTLPKHYILKLKNIQNGNEYVFNSNEKQKIPNGEYIITNQPTKDENIAENVGLGKLQGKNCATNLCVCVHPANGICKYPKVVINDTITISGNKTYNIKGNFKCQCFVYDNTCVEKCIWNLWQYNEKIDVNCITTNNNISIFYFWSNFFDYQTNDSYFFEFIVVAKSDGNYETCKYDIEANPYANNGLPYGNYYVLKPKNVENSEIDNIINIQTFTFGGALTPKN